MAQTEKSGHSSPRVESAKVATARGPRSERALASFEIASIGLGYRALDSLTRLSSIEIIEASVIATGRFLILAEGDGEELDSFATELRAALGPGSGENTRGALIDHEILWMQDRVILEAIYSLCQTPLSEALVVVECETVSALLSSLHILQNPSQKNHQLQVIEAKIHRGSKAGGYAFLTGSARDCALAAEEVRTHLKSKMRMGSIEHIDNPSEKFREQFNFSGRA